MKKLILLLLMVLPVALMAQVQQVGAPTTTVWVPGKLKSDKMMRPPLDTLVVDNGSLAYTDGDIWYKDVIWKRMGSIDTTSLSNRINAKLNITDTNSTVATRHWVNNQGFLTNYTETDPVFTAHIVSSIVNGTGFLKRIGGLWVYDNSTYLTSFTEVDGSVTNELQNLGIGTQTGTTLPLTISNGTGVTLPAATTSLAGLLTAADKTKLDGLSALIGSTSVTIVSNEIRRAALTGDATASANSNAVTVSGIRGVTVPTLATGNLRYNGSAFVFDNTTYLTSNQSITWTGAGDVTGSASGATSISPSLTIAADAVSNTKLANMAANTLKGNNTGSTADPADLTVSQVKTLLAYTTSDITEGSNLYFTNARARSAISLTTVGTSGAATYNPATGELNVPNYATGASRLNELLAANGTNSINNGGYTQTWSWNSISISNGLELKTNAGLGTWTSTPGALLYLERSGAHSGSAQYTPTVVIKNLHTGFSSANAALQLEASGGAVNYALSVTAGQVVLQGNPSGGTNYSLYKPIAIDPTTKIIYDMSDWPSGGSGISTLTNDVAATGSGSVAATVNGIKGTNVPTLATGYLYYNGSVFVWQTPGGAGTVTNFSAGNLSPLFTTSEATTTTTPALTFSLTNAAAYTVFGRNAGTTGAPTYFSLTANHIPSLDASKITTGTFADARIASASTWNAKLSNITGYITQGSGITITGSGTSGSPYVVNATAGGGGTVTSVGIQSTGTYQAAITIGASPVTTNGTINITPNIFNSVYAGVVPGSGGNSTHFLCADGTWKAPSGGGSISFNNVGSSPNAQAASVSGSTITLQPASATQPGVVTAYNQEFKGNKYFKDAAIFEDGTSYNNGGTAFFYEPTGSGSNSTYIVANNDVTANYGIMLPAANGSAGKFLAIKSVVGIYSELEWKDGPAWGTYTPTYTNVSNYASFTHQKATYQVVGNVVTVWVSMWGYATNTYGSFSVSLPGGYTISGSNGYDAQGYGFNVNNGAVLSLARNDSNTVLVYTTPVTASANNIFSFSFTFTKT